MNVLNAKIQLDSSKGTASKGSLNNPCTWQYWDVDRDGRMKKIQDDGTVLELVEHISDLLPKFLEHCFIKREQASTYNTQRESAASEPQNSKKALLQIDYSENYTCVSQDEIQSAHWRQSQVSLFTASLWHSGSMYSHLLASDDLTHTKDTNWTCFLMTYRRVSRLFLFGQMVQPLSLRIVILHQLSMFFKKSTT